MLVGMGVSLFYGARRAVPLSHAEQFTVDHVLDEFNSTAPIIECEPLGFYTRVVPGEVLAGATKLPLGDLEPEALQELIQHWLACLSALRRAVPDADWDVRLDDLGLPWFGDQDGYQLGVA